VTIDELMLMADAYADACLTCDCKKAPVSRNITREKLVLALQRSMRESYDAGYDSAIQALYNARVP